MNLDLQSGSWINKPSQCHVSKSSVILQTDPKTDLWQKSYYGFRNDNAPALLFETHENFTLTAKVSFQYKRKFDQCGLIIYLDSDNWFKSSIEYENEQFSRLGSVVTNSGYSDWATNNITMPHEIWYRLSRRGPDFLIEYSDDGSTYMQMRVFHLIALGETTIEMAKANPPLPAMENTRFGFYACSPSESSFRAEFTDIMYEPCKWQAHTPA